MPRINVKTLTNLRRLFFLDALLLGTVISFMYFQDAPSWALILALYVGTRMSRHEIGPTVRDEVSRELRNDRRLRS